MLIFLKLIFKVERELDNIGSRFRVEIVLKYRNNEIILFLEIFYCRIYMIVINIVIGFLIIVYRVICCYVEY